MTLRCPRCEKRKPATEYRRLRNGRRRAVCRLCEKGYRLVGHNVVRLWEGYQACDLALMQKRRIDEIRGMPETGNPYWVRQH